MVPPRIPPGTMCFRCPTCDRWRYFRLNELFPNGEPKVTVRKMCPHCFDARPITFGEDPAA